MASVITGRAAGDTTSGRLAILHLPRGRPAGRLAWFLCVLCLLAVGGGVALFILGGDTALQDSPFVLALLSFPLAGAWILSRRPDNPIGWIFIAIGLAWAPVMLVAGYAELADSEPGLPAYSLAAWVSNWAWIPGVYLLFFFLPVSFPDGSLPSVRWRAAVWIVAGAMAANFLNLAFAPGPLQDFDSVENPMGIDGLIGDVMTALEIGILFVPLAALLGFASLLVRYRGAEGDQRQQLKWVLSAVALGVVFFAIDMMLHYGVDAGGEVWLLGQLSFALLPAATTIAVLKYRLYDIDLILNRALVYGTLTAVIVAIYVLVVGYLGALFNIGNNLAVSLVAAGVVAVVFQPLRDWLQRAANRLLYGERDEPDKVISRLGHRLEASLAPDAVLPAVAETVGHALKLPRVEVALREGTELVVEADYESPQTRTSMGEAVSFALVYQNEEVGVLSAWPRAPGEGFSAGDRQLLEELARHAGVAAHALRLTRDLQRSRERLVAAREEERRRLRRDLHDGLGPALAALGLRVEAVRGLIKSAPQQAETQLIAVKDQVQSAISDIRRLVYGLRPPALDELGLSGALEQQAAALTADDESGPRFMIKCAPLPPLPAAVEVAAYRIAVEAMTNAQRHSSGRLCTVRLDAPGDLRIDVEDDGEGMDSAGWGVGLSSMRERAAELGGSLSVSEPPDGGTLVSARLPLEPAS